MHKKIAFTLVSLVCFFSLVSPSWSINFGDILKGLEKPQPKEQNTPPKTTKPQSAPSTPSTKPSASATEKKPAGGGGGLLGILEGTGAIDEKTSNILRGVGQVAQSMEPIGYAEERAIGGSLALEVYNKFGGAYKSEALQQYVSLVGQSVVNVSDRADIPYHFAVLNTNEPNAFATPGGYIFVSVGLLRMLENEAELGGVLGHEVAHVARKHALKTIERSKALSGISQLTTAILNDDPKILGQIVGEMKSTLFDKGLDQNLEYEADQVGTEYAYRVGYHPAGLKEFLKILGQTQGHASVFYSTHPSPRSRYQNLAAQVKKYSDAFLAPVLSKRYAKWTNGQL